jgi:Uma2 family endonuclease
MGVVISPTTEATFVNGRRVFSVKEYHRMHEVGILLEDDRVELIDGEIHLMSPIGTAHAAIVNYYISLFMSIGKTAIVSAQNPILLGNNSEPQPDLALLIYREDFYRKVAPTAADVLLVIEVSDSTLAYDRLEKLPRYALANIREVWITDVTGEMIECYTEPNGDQYATKQTFRRGQQLSVQALPAIQVSVDAIFG